MHSLTDRVQAWDRALQAVRSYFVGQGLCEVTPPVRLPAVAIEPYIEPVRADGGVLATSPELPMKMLLCHGAPDIYAIAPVHRAAESGRLHREGFHLIEWYRRDVDERAVRRDVEGLVAAVFEALGRSAPASWTTFGFLPLLAQTAGVSLRGDEDAAQLDAAVPASWRVAIPETMPDEARDLFAWSALLTTWSDAVLDDWLAQVEGGVHIVDYPPALAALAQLGRPRATEHAGPLAHRFESYVDGVELSNGYHELRDVEQQRARFEVVAALRRGHGSAALAEPKAFLQALKDPGLPPCAGAALGLERLVMLAHGVDNLETVTPIAW